MRNLSQDRRFVVEFRTEYLPNVSVKPNQCARQVLSVVTSELPDVLRSLWVKALHWFPCFRQHLAMRSNLKRVSFAIYMGQRS
jgi:hypothetical protein